MTGNRGWIWSRQWVRQFSNARISCSVTNTTSFLRKPQIDTKAIVNNAQAYNESLQKRGMKLPRNLSIDDLVVRLGQLRDLKFRKQQLLTQRNKLQTAFGKARREQGDVGSNLEQELRELKIAISQTDDNLSLTESDVQAAVEAVPNIISPDSVNLEQEQVIALIHKDKKIAADPQRRHDSICEQLGLVDFESATRVAGPSSYYLLGAGALLEQALVQYSLAKCAAKGWHLVTPPSMARVPFALACGFRPRDDNGPEDQIYTLRGDDGLCLAGTAEIPLAGLAAHKTLLRPARVVGVSRSYRAEAGSRGREAKGLYRVHEFTKVEMFAWTIPEQSESLHDEILGIQREIISELGLSARVLNMPPDDLGAPAYKKYDIEAWMPGRGDWGELTSASNCLDYQARRLHTKIQVPGESKPVFAHTLNGTACAIPRTIVALVEQHYDSESKTVVVPPVLRPYMAGITSIREQDTHPFFTL